MNDKELSEEIKRHIEEFLKRGGEITICPPNTYACDVEGTVRRTYRTKQNKNDG